MVACETSRLTSGGFRSPERDVCVDDVNLVQNLQSLSGASPESLSGASPESLSGASPESLSGGLNPPDVKRLFSQATIVTDQSVSLPQL